ncbi:MAG: hypothetical protein JWP67_1195 [Mucilaginibacter sp.]|nr:hypothetical protein [Mucilaginibacter sp.]
MTKLTLRAWFYNLIPALIWFLLLILPFINPPASIPEAMRHHFLVNVLITNTLLLFLFYIHTYLLYPVLKSKGWLIYLLSLCGLLICYWLYWWFFRGQPMRPPRLQLNNGMPVRPDVFNGEQRPPYGPPMGRRPGGFIAVLSPLIVLLCSYCYRIILDNNTRLANVKERETVHLRTELSFLRSQINPHFLFNVLNNLTLLARKKSELIEPAIVNLSQLMRYMLYESDENKVSLSKEVVYLKSYIELQRLRFGKEVTINADMDGDYSSFFIGPMLLISLVENAFKHGTDTSNRTTICITLKVTSQHKLYFSVINDIAQSANQSNESTGIGIKNLKRRLDILYPEKHILKVINHGLIFTAELSIDLGSN